MLTDQAQRPATVPAVEFFRHVRNLADVSDPADAALVERVEAAVLELVLRQRRRELGIAPAGGNHA
jgi:hypothetical protein